MPDSANTSSYQLILLAEAVRFYEAENSVDATYAESLAREESAKAKQQLFSQRIFKRAKILDQELRLSVSIGEIEKKYHFFFMCIIFLSAVVGFFSSQLLLMQQNDQQVNVYAVLLALLLPNALSLLLNGIVLLYKPELKTFNVFYVFQNAYKRLFGRRQFSTPAWKAWQSTRLRDDFSKWWFTASSNVLWLVFLLGALLGLFWRMSVHQYFFGWESTLLPASFFVNLTQHLAWPFQLLGLNIPAYIDILNSNLKVNLNMNAELSTRWAVFILSCVICYALIPRLIMVAFSWCKYKVSKATLKLDDSDFSYSKLYKNLMLHEDAVGIVDEDEKNIPGNVDIKSALTIRHSRELFKLPADAQLFTFELSQASLVLFQDDARFVINIEDKQSQSHALNIKNQHVDSMCVLVISVLSVPDRGTQRFLKVLSEGAQSLSWIFIHASQAKERFSKDVFSQRLYDWHMCAKALSLDATQLHMLDIYDQQQMQNFLMSQQQ